MKSGKEIYSMKLHETKYIDKWTSVLRVHSGWIYTFTDEGNDFGVFAPGPNFIDWLAKENKDLKQQRDDLLAACKAMVAILEIHLPPSDPKWNPNYLDKAKAAIAACKENDNGT